MYSYFDLWIKYRSKAIDAKTKLYATLLFYGTGSFLLVMGDFAGISESSMSKIIKQTSAAIAKLFPEFIHFPRTTAEKRETFQDFYDFAGFPRVIGAVDGTHVKIQSPGGPDAELFRNRKGYHSINVQSVSGPHLEFYDIVANWPGSTHDSHIFNMSSLKQRCERGEFDDAVIVADGGYGVQPYMMTPYRQSSHFVESDKIDFRVNISREMLEIGSSRACEPKPLERIKDMLEAKEEYEKKLDSFIDQQD